MCELLFKCDRGHETVVEADDVMDHEGNPPAVLQCLECLQAWGYIVWAFNCGAPPIKFVKPPSLPNDDSPTDEA